MAIARMFDYNGWSPEDYDKLLDALLDRLGCGDRTAREVFHWAAATPTGMRATDVYSSREAADALAREQIGPLAAQLGLPMPEITEVEVQRWLAP